MPDTGTNRRRFLELLTEFLMGLLALVVAFPAVAYFLAPLRKKSGVGGSEPGFQDVGPIADLPSGEWRLVSLEVVQADGWKKSRVRHAIWVQKKADGNLVVLSSICPHLGCPVNWHPDQSQFFCPCHGGVFNPDGRQISGPPPRAMDPLEFEVREGRLWVRWQDFKIGAAERVPVSV
jgi:menaquinol-cytochrome c reductase iron-sulfur subunit